MHRRTILIAGATLSFAGIPSADAKAGPVVETTNGKLRGLSGEGVQAFLGVPYGAAARFAAPGPAPSWPGVRDATAFGPTAPQVKNPQRPGPEGQLFRFAKEPASEDCLVLNVWTPAADGRKRPVMYWCHGGGFMRGSGQEPDYHGANLARKNDVVVVTLNHRLNVLGYCYLGHIDKAYAQSGNAGMLDLVQGLEWVRANIARFGGDPGNVTIFGESGGGFKVSVLLAMPAAKGLFHKAIIMSGPGVRLTEPEAAAAVTDALIAKLGVARSVAALKAVPIDALQAASVALSAPGRTLAGFSPVRDGVSAPRHPFDPAAPELSAAIPLIIGHTKDEATTFLLSDPRFGALTDAELEQRITAMLGPARARDVIARYRAIYPQDTPTYLLADIQTDQTMGAGSTLIAERKTQQGRAPAYRYLVTWRVPALGGKLRAAHGIDMALAFDNVEVARAGLYGSGPAPQQVADAISRSFATFARTGDPNHAGLPHWPAYSLANRETMLFDAPPRVENDPQKAQRLIWAAG